MPIDPPSPATVRGKVLQRMAYGQAQWSAAQLGVSLGLQFETVLRALNWLREYGYAELEVFIGTASLWGLTTKGRDAAATVAQLTLGQAA